MTSVHESLLAWYDRNARDLPWRTGPKARAAGQRPDPYRVWLSEVMLQQTTVQAAKSYFAAFTERWPALADLAAAPRDEVMEAWAGLGYYSRARNLKACAEAVAQTHGGVFPQDEKALLALPGIGAYTAAAIAAIAFDRRAVVVDGNVERVVTRLRRIETPLPKAKAEIRAATDAITPAQRPGDFAQAMMDLGATICTPRNPVCALCPLNTGCEAARAGDMEVFPVKAKKTDRPVRHGAVLVAVRADGAILLQRRPDKGLLGGMAGLPGTAWTAAAASGLPVPALPALQLPALQHTGGKMLKLPGTVEHTFTHFHLVLDVWHQTAASGADAPDGCWWSGSNALGSEALPSVMRKAILHALPGSIAARGPANRR